MVSYRQLTYYYMAHSTATYRASSMGATPNPPPQIAVTFNSHSYDRCGGGYTPEPPFIETIMTQISLPYSIVTMLVDWLIILPPSIGWDIMGYESDPLSS